MSLTIRRHGDVGIIDLQGPLTGGYRADALRVALHDLFDRGLLHVVINLQDTPFIDSLGLGELLTCRTEANTLGGDIRLLLRPGKVYGVLVDANIDRLFGTFSDEAAAVGSF